MSVTLTEFVRSASSCNEYRICSNCVMDTSDPTIRFDDAGICDHCHAYAVRSRHHVINGEEGLRRLQAIVDQIKIDGAGKPYDCIIGVSGGVDSTVVACKTKELELKPLAVHLDNGWDSEIAVSNIAAALKKLGIDLHTHVLDWDEFKDIQRAFLLASTPDAEIPSDHAIFAILYHTASQFGIRHVITGLNVRTETHVPVAWSQGHWDWGYIRAVHRKFGSRKIRTFPRFSFFEYVTMCRHSHVTTNLLDYIDYSKTQAIASLRRDLGWKDYGGKHYENVYTRWFQGCYLPRKFGFDKRRSHLSSLICSGEINRAQAIDKLKEQPYPIDLQQQDCEYVAKKLGFNIEEFDHVMNAPLRKFEDFPSYHKMRKSWWFPIALRIYQVLKYGQLRRTRK